MTPRRPTLSLAAYGLPAFGLEATVFMSSLYLVKFATGSLAIAPVVVGLILGIGRLWDAVSDPLVGYASDRTRTALGRRRPWMLVGAPLLAAAFAALWMEIGEPGSLTRVAAFALATLGFYSAVTLVAVPHAALGASLARAAHSRNRLFAARAIFKNLGLAAVLVALYQLERAPSVETAAVAVGLWLGGGAAAAITLGAWLLREPRADRAQPRSSIGAMRAIARHGGARRILAVLGLEELALGALLVVLPFVSEILLESPGRTALYLVAFVVPMTCSIPLWVRAGRALGEYRAWQRGNALQALGFLPLFFAGAGDELLVVAAAALIGIGHGAGRVLAMTALAVAADDDALQTGEAKEGLFYATATFVEKCAAGLAAFAVGAALHAAGFEAGSAATPATVGVLRVTASLVPALLITFSCALLGGAFAGRRIRAPWLPRPARGQ